MTQQAYTKDEQAEHRKQWVQALRSDSYQQAQGKLRGAHDGFCCLGVACDISGLGEWDDGGYLGERGSLPDQVMDWLGLEDAAGGYIASSLSNLNDVGVTFEAIADMIEMEPDGLLKEDNRG